MMPRPRSRRIYLTGLRVMTGASLLMAAFYLGRVTQRSWLDAGAAVVYAWAAAVFYVLHAHALAKERAQAEAMLRELMGRQSK